MVKAKVLDIDIEKERISLGIKQLTDDPFESATGDLKKGAVVTCTVTSVTDGGLEVSVSGGLQGFIRRSDLSRERSEQRPDRYAVGDRIDAQVTNIDRREHKLNLSVKAHEIKEEKEAMDHYGSSDSGASLGDILGAAMRKAGTDEDNASEAEAEPAVESAAEESAEEAPAAEEAAPEAEAAEEAPAKELASEDSEEAEKKD